MYLGIRPALKARPSLLDLIRGGGDSGGLSGLSGEGSSIAAGSAGSSTATVATRPPAAGGLDAIPAAATSSPPPPLAAPRQVPGSFDSTFANLSTDITDPLNAASLSSFTASLAVFLRER
ncbi:unnamed protein product [Clonostachys byssicola]|uniref:Uncharacterized protein n=1 Tax=Clonostachys byssicola TaxID=160290 RepID=A0A9N9UZ57_9HYPO|nr:unnamed protein product [Clonostachys byssicola]